MRVRGCTRPYSWQRIFRALSLSRSGRTGKWTRYWCWACGWMIRSPGSAMSSCSRSFRKGYSGAGSFRSLMRLHWRKSGGRSTVNCRFMSWLMCRCGRRFGRRDPVLRRICTTVWSRIFSGFRCSCAHSNTQILWKKSGRDCSWRILHWAIFRRNCGKYWSAWSRRSWRLLGWRLPF